MTRVVLDTNILVSALLKPTGTEAIVFLLVESRLLEAAVSEPVFSEYEEVLRRPKFAFAPETVTAALRVMRERSYWAAPTAPADGAADQDDNKFLECAQASQADYLVTGNLRHFPGEWNETKIVTTRQFIQVLADIPDRQV